MTEASSNDDPRGQAAEARALADELAAAAIALHGALAVQYLEAPEAATDEQRKAAEEFVRLIGEAQKTRDLADELEGAVDKYDQAVAFRHVVLDGYFGPDEEAAA
jgi:hypothetical protein